MKFEPAKLSKFIEQNYSYLMPNFYKMQAEYMNSMNEIYKDLVSSDYSKKILYPYLQNTVKLLGLLISKCLETYSSKKMKII